MKRDYKLTKATIGSLVNELNNAIDLKLNGENVSMDSFKTANGLYLAIFNKFEYKYFPTKAQESVLNIVKAFQAIGFGISEINLTNNELRYIKYILSNLIISPG